MICLLKNMISFILALIFQNWMHLRELELKYQ